MKIGVVTFDGFNEIDSFVEAAIDAPPYVAPVGQEEEYISRAVAAVAEFIAEGRLSGATAV
jgi:hypothetical protein